MNKYLNPSVAKPKTTAPLDETPVIVQVPISVIAFGPTSG